MNSSKAPRTFTSSIFVNLGGSQVRSVHEDQTVEFQLDPVSKKFIKDGKLSKGKEKVPEFIVKPRRQFVNEGQTAKFKCSFDGSPQTSLTWSKDGTPLSPGKKYKVYEEGDLHWLDICDVTSEDVGSYTCLAHNSAGSCKEKAELDVYVKPTTGTKKSGFVAPKVDIPLCDLHVTPGDRNVTLECKFSNAIDASASWFKDGRLLTSGFLSKQSFDGRLARLIINRVAIKDSGSYECVVSNTGGEAKTKASLTVIVPGTRSIPPKFVNPLSNLTLKEGEKLVYEAKVTGYPKPTINWYKDGKIIRSGKTLTTEFDGSTVRLVMAKVTKTDGAIYKCIAENEAGKDQIKSTLTVEGSSDAAVGDFREPPKFVRELHDIEVDDGDTVELAVEVKGMHPIRLVWFHNKKEVLANDPVLKLVSHGDSHSLIIPECVAEDAGSFVCEAYNDVGRCETCCRLRVKDIEEENQEEDIVTNINTKTGNYLQIDEHLHEHKNVNVDPVHRENKDDLHSFEDDKTVLNNSNGGDCLRHPEFVLKPQISQVEEGKSAIFLCRGTGTPIPTAYWSRQGEIIQNKGRYKVSTGEDNVLEIKTVTLSDADKYTCTLTNQAGSVSIETNLTVIPRKVAQTDFRSVLRTSSQQPKNGTSNFLTSDKNSKEKSGVYNFRKVLTNKQDKITTDTQPKSQIVSNYTDVLKKNKTSTQSENIKKRSTSPKLEATRTQNLDHIGNVKLESNKSNKPMETKTFRTVLKPSRVSDIGSEHGGKSGIKQGENNIDFRSVLKKTGNVPNIGKSVNPSAKTLKQTNSNQIDFRHVLQTRKDGESGKQSDNVTATDYSVHRQQKSKITSFVKEPIRPESLRMKDSEHSAKIVFTKGVRESHLEQDSKNGATYLNKEQIQSLPEVPPKPKRTQKIEKMLNQLDEATDEILAMGSNPTSIKSINREITENNDAHPAKQIWIGQTSEFVTIDEKSEPEFQLMNTPTKLHEKFSHESENLNLSKVEIKSGSIEDSEPRQIYTAEFSPTTTVVENSDNVEIVPNITQSTDINVPNNSTNSSICSNNILSDENENKIQKPKNRNVLLRLNSQEKLPVLSRSVDKRPRQHPVFKSSLKDITVAEGSCVTMECEVFGIPRPEITWFMNNNRIKPSKFFQMTHEEDLARLVIEGAYPEDDGDYMCTASNVVGIETQTCHLFVTESSGTSTDQTGDEQEDEEDFLYGVPEIHEISPTSLSVKRGKKVDVLASFSAETQAQVIWLKEKIPIQLGNRFCVVTCENSSCLTIYNVELEDSGTYDVLVETCHGEDTRSMTISVEDVPDKPVGHPYASEATLRSVILSWCGPAYDGGSPVTNYKIEICDAEERVWRLLSDKCHSTSYKATDLTPHTPYFFRVSAVNKHGTGQPSETPEVVVTKDQRPDMRLSVESDEEEDLPAPFSPRIVSVRKDDSFDDFYILKGELGKGKFGSVYQCIEKCDGATWAAKILKCRAKDKAIIYNEISVMNELTHPKLLMLRDAFETARSIILVMEYVGGGELFERVVNEDFELTERDCVHFLRQICEGVQYMHSKHIVHLDLKPENILCVRNDSNLIKIIDFGLARFHKPGESLRAMVGTPEFVAPEIVNFEEIGFPTDIWSLGVICYVLLSGLSPFMGDSDTETLANVTRGEFDFDDDAFLEISGNAKDFIQCSLQKNPRKRMSINDCLHHRWLEKAEKISSRKLRQSLRNLKQFIARRKWQKMGTAIRAIGRMSSLQKLFKHGEGSGNDKNSTHSNSYSDTASQSELSPLELKSSEKVEEILQESKSSSGIEEDRGQSSTSSSTTEDRLQMQTTDDINLNNNVFKKPITDKSDSTSVCDIESTKLQIQENSLTSLSSIPSTISEDGSPQFLQEMVDCEAFTGDVIRFDVQVNGSPEPSVEWFREDTTIQADSRHTLRCGDNGDYSLIIRNVTEDDDAEYSCKASNSLGEVTCTAELIICGTGAF